jgi:rhamnosyl/mannosyltransferase
VCIVRPVRWATVASAPIAPGLLRHLRHVRADVTHLHVPYPVGELAWLLVGRSPMVVTYHSDIVRQRLLGAFWAPGLRRVLAGAACVLATSPNYARSSPFLREVGDRLRIVPLGIDTRPFATVDRQGARSQYGPGPMLVFLGRLRYYKGLDVLIDALVHLPDVRLLVAGEGPMETAWRQRAAERGVGARVTWLGHVPDGAVPGVLAAGDAYALPASARSEAFGIAVLEAMAAGLPVISTELDTGTSWVNQDGVTGRVVPPGDPLALAAAIRAILADESARQRMGEAARERVAQHFTAARMIAAVEEVYREVTT